MSLRKVKVVWCHVIACDTSRVTTNCDTTVQARLSLVLVDCVALLSSRYYLVTCSLCSACEKSGNNFFLMQILFIHQIAAMVSSRKPSFTKHVLPSQKQKG